jgi:hypothetical protein
MTSRPYTGNKDGPHPKPREGTTVFKDHCCYLFGVTSLGIYANRPVKGSPSKTPVLSVHATWRAFDLSCDAVTRYKLIDFLYTHRDILGVEEIHDYANTYKPSKFGWGAGYRCDRDAWRIYEKNTIGSKNGQWVHVEISPLLADHPDIVNHAFKTIFKGA